MGLAKRLERLVTIAADSAEHHGHDYLEAYFRALENHRREEAGLEPLPYRDIERESDEHFLAVTIPAYRALPGWQSEECREIIDQWEQHTRERDYRKELAKLMGRSKSFERRAREEVVRIKAEEAAEEERKQARMRELAEEARKQREAMAAEERRLQAERDAKLRHDQKERSQAEQERAKRSMYNTWIAQGGDPEEFEAAWPSMRAEQLKQRTLEADNAARESQRYQPHSRI